MQRIATGHLNCLDHAFNVGAVLGCAGVPGNVSTTLKSSFDEFGRYSRCQRIVAAEELDAQSTLFKGDVNERFHFVFAGCRRLERKWRRSKLQDSHVDACAILRNVVENVVQWAGHIQTSRDTVHREHFRAERRAPHRAEVNVTVDDAGLQHQTGEIDHFACGGTEIGSHGRNQAVFNGDITNIVDAV